MSGKNKAPRGSFYGDLKERTCLDCGFTANWRGFTPYDGNPSKTVCDSCVSIRESRNRKRLYKEDLRNFDHMERYLCGLRGNGPFGSFFNAMLGGLFRQWVKRMESYGPFDIFVVAKLLCDHYSKSNAHRRKHWIVFQEKLEVNKRFHPLRRFKHPYVKRKNRKNRAHKYIKPGDIVFLWTGSALEQTVSLRSTTLMPELGVELSVSIPKDMPREYQLDVYSKSKVVGMPSKTISNILGNNHDFPSPTKCGVLTTHCSKQLESLINK